MPRWSRRATRLLVARAERAILSEIDKLRTNTVSEVEIEKARRRFELDYLERLSTPRGRALFLIDAAFAGKPMSATIFGTHLMMK